MKNQNAGPGWDEAAAHNLIELCRSGQLFLGASPRGELWPVVDMKRDPNFEMSMRAFKLFIASFGVLFRWADQGQLSDIAPRYRQAGLDEDESMGAGQLAGETNRRTREIRRHKPAFRAGCQWILPRLGQLQSAGWSLRDLFGVDSCAPPWGRWGLAWSWPRADEIVLEDNGAICFRFHEADRVIEQRSRPHWRNK
jgi:hypothetical protein